MIAMLLVGRRFVRAIARGLRDPEFQTLAVGVGVILAIGTVFYSAVEGWGVLDSLYFCVTTLTTIGFGDPSPATALGKIFTIVYVIIGIGIIASFITMVATYERRERQEKRDRADSRD